MVETRRDEDAVTGGRSRTETGLQAVAGRHSVGGMSDAVTATYILDIGSFRKSRRFHAGQNRLLPWCFGTITLISLGFTLWIGIGYGAGDPAFKWAAGTTIYFPFLLWLSGRLVEGKFKKSAFFGKTMRFELTAAGVDYRSDSAVSKMTWAAYTEAKIGEAGILLYIQPGQYHWIPASGFASPADFDTACATVKAGVKKVKDRR